MLAIGDMNAKTRDINEEMSGANNRQNKVNVTPLRYNFKLGKLTDRRYYRLVNRNDWTMREFAELTLCVLNQINNRDVPTLIYDLEDFLINSDLPFWEVLEDSTGVRYSTMF